MRITWTRKATSLTPGGMITDDDLLRLTSTMEEQGWAVSQLIPTPTNWIVVFERTRA